MSKPATSRRVTPVLAAIFAALIVAGCAPGESRHDPDKALLYIHLHAADLALMSDLAFEADVGSSRVDLQACKLEYSIVSPK